MTGVLVLGATNKPYSLDEALRRRFQKRVYIPLPDATARAYMFKLYLGPCKDKEGVVLHTLVEEDYMKLAESTDMFSGSDISTACTAITNSPLTVCTSAKLWVPDASGKKFFPLPLYTIASTTPPPSDGGGGVSASVGGAETLPLCTEDLSIPNCSHPQHPRLPGDPVASLFPPFVPPTLPLANGQKFSEPLCPQCRCVYIDSMYNWDTEQVGVPPFTFSDCKRVLAHTRGSVGKKQLEEYEACVSAAPPRHPHKLHPVQNQP